MEQPSLRSAHQPYPHRRGRVVRHGDAEERRRTSVGSDRAAMGRNGDMEPIRHFRQNGANGGTLGRMGLRRRRRHRHLELAPAVQLPHSWGHDPHGAIAGGIITYTANGAQKIAVAAGFTMLAWPTKIVKAKIVVLGL